MKKPKDRGKAIDGQRFAQWVSRFPGYRQEVTEGRITNWINQFTGGDRDIAARVLDCVNYVSHESIEEVFEEILEKLDGWDRDERKRKGRWRFVAFSKAAGESGDTMLHKLRTSTKMTGAKYEKLCIHKSDLLKEKLGPEDNVVFLDDFAGTGNQVCTGWEQVMEELLPGEPNTYLILVAVTKTAIEKIQNQTPMQVMAHIKLRDEDNFFSGGCTHFTVQEKARILTYCRRANNQFPRGYGDCGLVIVLAHRTPNNSIPILHANHDAWVGLFARE